MKQVYIAVYIAVFIAFVRNIIQRMRPNNTGFRPFIVSIPDDFKGFIMGLDVAKRTYGDIGFIPLMHITPSINLSIGDCARAVSHRLEKEGYPATNEFHFSNDYGSFTVSLVVRELDYREAKRNGPIVSHIDGIPDNVLHNISAAALEAINKISETEYSRTLYVTLRPQRSKK